MSQLTITDQRDYKNFTFDTMAYEQDNHFSVWPKALIDGLISVFEC